MLTSPREKTAFLLNQTGLASYQNWLLFAGYILVMAVLLSRHEMWRDELHSWTICVYSDRLPDIFTNTAYEGHPKLWYLMLWPLTRLSADPVVMQIGSWLLLVASAWIICFKSPFSFLEKALLLGGYYFLFEYGVLVRNYQIAVLLFLVIAVYWKELPESTWKICLLLSILIHANAFALLTSFGITAALLRQEFLHNRFFFLSIKRLLPFLLLGASCLLWVITVTPPADSSVSPGWQADMNFKNLEWAITRVNTAFFPVPQFAYSFWQTSIFTNPYLKRLVLFGIVCSLFYLLWKRKNLLLMLSVSLFVVYLFSFLKYAGNLRHNGNLFIIFVVACWIYLEDEPGISLRNRWPFVMILVIHAIAGLYAVYMDFRYPFSTAKAVAEYMKSNKITNYAIGINYYLTPVAAYLQKTGYSLNTESDRAYVKWRRSEYADSLFHLPDSLLAERFLMYQRTYPDAVLLSQWYPLRQPSARPGPGQSMILPLSNGLYQVSCRKAFTNSIVADEIYYLLDVKPLRQFPARAFSKASSPVSAVAGRGKSGVKTAN